MLFQDRKRKVLLPEEVGEKGFLESRFPAFRIDSSGKGMQRTGFEGPDWQVAEGHKRALWMWKTPEGPKLANMDSNVAKMVAKVTKLIANSVTIMMPTSLYRQVRIESPL
ncbi:hypothetical protein TNCV_3501631 [Trichonephila clavipes]|uniref:Uncharacterized protein n=1 Tax=Trichonephila clavipes TaxID=2585209 RepID=A0A8X6S0F7_TRICX|nr:hypothetical protein TNCV_3501631 [Trichonephila clavipes]